jgi:hypothetical protein
MIILLIRSGKFILLFEKSEAFFHRDTIQAFASSITNALAFSAILEGMGVGDEKASVLSATFVWLIKDGVGMLGRILFAWLHGTGNL